MKTDDPVTDLFSGHSALMCCYPATVFVSDWNAACFNNMSSVLKWRNVCIHHLKYTSDGTLSLSETIFSVCIWKFLRPKAVIKMLVRRRCERTFWFLFYCCFLATSSFLFHGSFEKTSPSVTATEKQSDSWRGRWSGGTNCSLSARDRHIRSFLLDNELSSSLLSLVTLT